MKTPVLLAFVGLATGFIAPAFSQTTPKDLVGTWTLVSITLEYDGKKMDFFGANLQGQVTFNPNGRFSVIITNVHQCWNRLLGLESREVGGGRRGKKTLAHEFSVQMRSMDNDKTGSGLGLAMLVALEGAMLEPHTAGGLISGRFPQPRWFDRDATERVSNPSSLPLKTAPLA